jgi:dTDP-4-dehydrorhamnose 3,5-epimerase
LNERPISTRATGIDGLTVIVMKEVREPRGIVREFYRESAFVEAGLPSLGPWVQINVTETKRGSLRGLHGEDMFKLVAVVAGEAFGAYVDARPESPTCGKVVTVRLVEGTAVLVPRGVCNGFQAVNPGSTQYLYAFDSEWRPGMAGIAVNALDPALGIDWPLAVTLDDETSISPKDRGLPTFEEALREARARPGLEN